MAVELHAECAKGYAVIRRWYRFENRRNRMRVLRDASIVADPVRWAEPIEQFVYKFDTHDDGSFLRPVPPLIQPLSAVDTEEVTGSLELFPLLMLRTARGRGLFWGWAYSGKTHFGVMRAKDGSSGLVRVSFLSSKSKNEEDVLSYRLEAGQAFTTPEQFVGVFEGDWDEGCYRVQRYADRWCSGITAKNPHYPLTLIDSWGMYSIREDNLKQVIDWASQAGLDAMDIDFGWAIAGDWKPRPEFFPSGSMAALADYASRRHIKLIVHLPFGDLDHESEVYKLHPEWTYGKPWKLWKDETGRQGLESTLCITNEAARTWMLNRVSQTLVENRLIGFDPDFSLFTSENVPCKFLSGSASQAAPEYSRWVFGLYPFLEELLQRHKGLVIENAGGIMGAPVYDFATAKWFSHTISTVSIPITERAPEYIRANYYISYLVSPRWPADYFSPLAHHEVVNRGRIRLNNFCLRIFLLGGSFYLEVDPGRLDTPGKALLIKYVQMFKRLRSWTSDGEVLHLMDPERSASWNGWAALGNYNPDADRAIVIAWHYQGPQNEMTIPMKALKPDHRYVVSLADGDRKFSASGEEIMRQGFHLSLDAYSESLSDKSSELIFVDPYNSSRLKTEGAK